MKRAAIWSAVVLAVGVASASLMFGPSLRQLREVGTGYVAHELCACVFITERDVDACRSDLLPGVELIESEIDPRERRVTTRFLFRHREARHRPPLGCTLYPDGARG